MNSETSIMPSKKGFFSRLKDCLIYLREHKSFYLLFCFLVPTALMYILYLLREIHPFGDGSVLVLDMNGQYVYYFEALRDKLTSGESFLYSFSRTLGGEFLGIYSYYLASPLSYIVLLFPKARILEAILTIILIKVGLCGVSFGFYLHKHTDKPNKLAVIIFSSLYALGSYAVVYQNNTMWIDAIYLLPIVTYALEQLILKRRYKLYVVSLAITMISNYYIGYMVCIYAVIYFFYYWFSHKKQDIVPEGEKAPFIRSFSRFAGFSVLSALISAFMLFAAYYSLSFGKSDFSTPKNIVKLNFNPIEFFTKFLPGTYDTVRPQGLPFVYCGMIVLLLVPIYFLAKRISGREKLSSLIFISVFVLSFVFNPIDLVWHGFQRPNWLNYRYSFMLCFFLLVIAYKGFINLKKSSRKFLIILCAMLVPIVLLLQNLEFKSYVTSDEALLPKGTVLVSVIAAVIITVLLCLMVSFKSKKTTAIVTLALAATISAEIICNGFILMRQFDDDVLYSGYNAYNTFIGGHRPIISELEEYDPGFYRAEKVTHKKYNDNLALGLNGISGSTSTLHAASIKLLNHMGYVSQSHYSQYKGGNPIGDSILGIKYLIDEKDSDKLSDRYDAVLSDDDYSVYLNPYAMSLAYGVSDSMYDLDLDDYDTPFESLNALASALIGEDTSEIFTEVPNYSVTANNCITSRVKYAYAYSRKSSESRATVNYSLVAPYDGEYYFYPTCDYQTEVKLRVNGKYFGKYNGTKTDYIVSLGYFEEGDRIKVELEIGEKALYLRKEFTSIWYFNEGEFTEVFDKLIANPQFEIDENYSQDHLAGRIDTTQNNQTILTTIPYDEGWKVYVDGEQVNISKGLDSLISFKIDEPGDHTLELKYSPAIYKLGAILSIVGIIIFLLLIFKLKPSRICLEEKPWDLEEPEENTASEESDNNGSPSETEVTDNTETETDTTSETNSDGGI